MSNATLGKYYVTIFNDITDTNETGGVESWENGTLAYDMTLDALFVNYQNGWLLVGTQTV